MPQAMDLLITGVDVVTFDDPGTVVLGGAPTCFLEAGGPHPDEPVTP